MKVFKEAICWPAGAGEHYPDSSPRWSESRGVYDDVCYLRRWRTCSAIRLDGLNTDIARDGDNYLANKLEGNQFSELEMTWPEFPATC